MTAKIMMALLCGFVGTTALPAQERGLAPEDPVHNELRAMRDGLLDAYQKKEIDRMLTYLHENVVVTFQNGAVIRGRAGMRDFHRRMMEGENRTIKSVKTDLRSDELSIIHGDDAAVAFGTVHDEFELANGMNFDLKSRWSATLVKEGGRWLVASFHVSANVFDNAVSSLLMKWNTIKVGAVALVAGLILGGVVAKVAGKLRRRTEGRASAP